MTTLPHWRLLQGLCIAGAVAFAAGQAVADEAPDTAALAQSGFAAICTNPGQTAAVMEARMRAHVANAGGSGLPFGTSFYDTTLGDTPDDPTPGTNRRCEVSFPGDHVEDATETLRSAMQGPPVFGTVTELPDGFEAHDGTHFIQARLLNSRGIRAVVHVGTRDGPDGQETFINVERLPPPAD